MTSPLQGLILSWGLGLLSFAPFALPGPSIFRFILFIRFILSLFSTLGLSLRLSLSLNLPRFLFFFLRVIITILFGPLVFGLVDLLLEASVVYVHGDEVSTARLHILLLLVDFLPKPGIRTRGKNQFIYIYIKGLEI